MSFYQYHLSFLVLDILSGIFFSFVEVPFKLSAVISNSAIIESYTG